MKRMPSLSVSVLSLLASSTCIATTLHVCPAGCDFARIQDAVNAAASGDTIEVAQGRYVENVRIVAKNLQIVGAGNGRTVVDGASRDSVFTLGTGADSPFAEISISNLAVTHGMATNGGGISVLAGAFANLQGVLAVSNVAHNNGAGIYINTPGAPTTTIKGCAVHNNKVDQNTTFTTGGGIAIFSSIVTIDSSTITRNIVPLAGGGVAFTAGESGAVTITSSSIVDNQTQQDLLNNIFVGGGGGVYFDGPGGGSLTVSKSDVSRNTSAGAAGGLETFGTAVISDTIVSRNLSRGGGGISTGGSGRPLTLKNDYIVQNAGGAGPGGVDNGGSPLFITHTTIKDNVPDDCEGTDCPP
jgi:hypothetical protein